MNASSFAPMQYIAEAADTTLLSSFSFVLRDAIHALTDHPELGTATTSVTGVTWSVESTDGHAHCLVGRGPRGNVAVIIFARDSKIWAASSKLIPGEVKKAMEDMMHCLASGNAPWIRVSQTILEAAFDIVFHDAKPIPFDGAWANGTGWMNGAMHVTPDGARSFTDSHGRRGVLLPCHKDPYCTKNVVIFERFAGEKEMLLVFNAPSGYTHSHCGPLSADAHLHRLLLQHANVELVEG